MSGESAERQHEEEEQPQPQVGADAKQQQPPPVQPAEVIDAVFRRRLEWAMCDIPPPPPVLGHFVKGGDGGEEEEVDHPDHWFSVSFDHDEEGVVSSGLHLIMPKKTRTAITANVTTGSKRDLAKMIGGDSSYDSDSDSDNDDDESDSEDDDDDSSPMDDEGSPIAGQKRSSDGSGGKRKKRNKISLDRFLDFGEAVFHVRVPPEPKVGGDETTFPEGDKDNKEREDQEEGVEAEVVVQTYRLVRGKMIDNRLVVWGRASDHVESLLRAAWKAEGKSLQEEERNEKGKGVTFYQPLVSPIGTGWVKKATLAPRDGNTLILNGDTLDRVIADAKEFLKPETKSFYAKCGIPYKRHYLLHGLPGTGKSSLVHVVAAATDMDVYHLNIGTLAAESFMELMENRSRRRIVLMEDIDGVYTKDGERQDVAFPLPVLLNALDSCSAEGGLLVFMTTNFRDKLTRRLIRPGRVDVEVEFERSSPEQARKLVELYAPDAESKVADAVSRCAARHVVTPAMIQRAVFRRGTTFTSTEAERAASAAGGGDASLDAESVVKELKLMATEEAEERGESTGMFG